MTRATVTITGPAERDQIARWARNVEEGTVVTFRKKSRSSEQSAKMWAMLHEIAEQVDWYGQKLEAEDWKDIATASLRHARVVPGIDKGTYVPLGMHTSTMTIEEMTNLIDLLYAFGAEHNVIFKEPKTDTNSEASSTPEDADATPPSSISQQPEMYPSSSPAASITDEGPGRSESGADVDEKGSASAILSENDILIRYARDVLPMAADSGVSLEALKATDKEWASEIKKLSDVGIQRARAISDSSRAVFNDPARLDGVLEHYAHLLDCSVEDLRGEVDG